MKLTRTLLLSFAALLYTATVHAQVNLSSGLVAYYPFNGNTLDFSGNYNNGIIAGNVAFNTDAWGNASSACTFTGTNTTSMITVPNNATLQFSTACSFSFWLKINSVTGTNGFGNIVAGGDHCVFAKDGDAGGGLWFNTSLTSAGAMNNRIGNVSMTTCQAQQTGISVGQWQHFVYIMDATEQRMYINGVLVQTVPGAPNFNTMNTKNLVLARYTSGWYPMNGALDEFRVYNRAINAAEVATLATTGTVSASVTNIAPATVCAGQQITVDISSTGAIATGNTYSVQLSDATGAFTRPIVIGSLVSNATAATITCTVPEGVPSGTGYKLRVTTNTPVSIGTASTASLTVNGVLGDIPSAASFRFIGNMGGRNYFVSLAQQTWAAGRTTCSNNGGILAYVPDAATNALLAQYSTTTGAYIGYTDEVTEGTWVWEGGYPSGYTSWHPNEPNNSGNEDYAMTGVSGFWNDVGTSTSAYYLYQLNAARSNSPVCSGTSITLFGATVSGGATYQWSGPNGFTSTMQSPVISNATFAHAGVYTLVITKGGCSATVTTTVSIVQGPNATGQTSSLLPSLSSGLLLHYPFNTNANDASGNGLHGTMIGGITATADRFGNPGNALQFNGTNGYVDAPDGIYFNGDFTVSCWLKVNSYNSWSRVFDFGNGPASNNVLMAISQGTTGRPSAELFNGTTSGGNASSASVAVGTNLWQMLTYTYTGTIGRLYLNGTQIASGMMTVPQNVLRTFCYIGRSNWSVDGYANAAFDDFRIYNRAITTQEMISLVMEQPNPLSLVAMPASVCPNTAGTIKVVSSQKGVTYQLQNAATNANVGAAQAGTGDTLTFATGNLTANTTFQVVATGPNGCTVTISSVTVNIIVLPALPTTVGASRCGPGSVTLNASGAPANATYNWYTSSSGGNPVHTGSGYATPTLSITTTYYVSILFNGCETGRSPVTATINLATAPAVDLYNGLIAHWMFDGNTADSSGRGNNATLNWNGAYVADRLGQAARALQPVVNAYVDAGNPGDFQMLTTQVTLSLWINQTGTYLNGSNPLMNKWQNNGLYMGLDNYYDAGQQQQMNRVRWRINGATYVNSSVNVPYNTWHHIVCTYNGSRLKIYQNGVQTGDLAYTGVITNTITNFQIGRQANGLGSFIFQGIYDEGRVYNRALNPDEVMALYNNGMVAFSNSPVCAGNTLQLNSPFISGATYTWTGPNGFSSNQQVPAPILNAAAVHAGTYTLIISNPNGCVTAPQTNTVVVNPLPAAPTTVHDTVCGSGNAVLLASGAPPGGSYEWYTVPIAGTPIVGQTSGTYTINNLTSTQTFYVAVVSAAGCPSPARTPVTALYNNPVVQSMQVSGATICDNITTSSITMSSSQSGVMYQAFWNSTAVSAVTNGTGSALTIPITTAAMNPGVQVINVIASQPGCGNVNITDTARINVLALPNATVTSSGPTTFCSGGNVTLSVPMSASYLWSNGATTQTILVTTAGTYSVAVTNAAGCVANSSAITVNVIAPPVATLSVSGPTTFCQGGSVTLTAGGGGTYLWSNNATTSSITVNTSGTFYCTVSNGSCTDVTTTTVVTVNPAPSATVTPSGPTTFCSGDNVTLFANAASGYLWSNGATASSITVGNSGSYFVITTGANGCTAQSPAVTVTVNATPNATITASGPTTFCSGGNVTLTAGGGTSYLWSSGATSPAISASTSGNYYCIVSNGTCSDTTNVITVTVNPSPAANITASGPLSFCAGDNVTLTASASNGYLWSNGATTQSITVSSSGNYSVTTSSANGCTAVSSTVAVTVNSTPNATITPSAPATICQGDVVTLTAGGGSSYLWNTGATSSTINVGSAGSYYCIVSNGTCSDTTSVVAITVNLAPAASISASGPTTFCTGNTVTLTAAAASSYLWSTGATTQSITVSSSGSYHCTVSGANGCTAVSNTIAVTVVPSPTATISAGGPTTFCQGNAVTLYAGGGSSYLWNTGATSSSIVVTQSGAYSVQVSNGSCGVTSSTINVNVLPLPNVQFSMGNDTSFCVFSNPVVLTGGSPAGGTYSGLGIIGNQFFPGAAGTGYVTLTYHYTDVNGCDNSANAIVYVDICMGMEDAAQTVNAQTYPNPAAGQTTVQWNAASNISTLEVFDASGKLVYAENVNGKTSVQLNMHDWADGIYAVRLIGDSVQTIRVVRGE